METGGAFGAENDTLQLLYCQEIERVISELNSLLLRLDERVDATIIQACDALWVLRSCYLENVLSIPALDVLLQHLLALRGVFKRELN